MAESEVQPREPDVENPLDEVEDPTDPTISATGFAYAPEEDWGMEMEPVIVGPPAYGSPDPATSAGRLLALRDHPLTADRVGEDHPAAISEDYGDDVTGTVKLGQPSGHGVPVDEEAAAAEDGEEGEYDSQTVAELKDEARGREIEGYSTMNKKELIDALKEDDEANG